MKLVILSNGAKIVKRYRRGRCYGAAFSADTSERQIKSAMCQGEACFFPFNESTNQFDWSHAEDRGRPLRIRR